jgi:23S rRNA (guanine745-N1)-methyltransferase
MVAARERFLSGGHYEAVVSRLSAATGSIGIGRVLDCGAGTGYYLSRTLDAHPSSRGIALDVSVAAARRAARTHPRVGAVVADAWQSLPLSDQSIDLILSVFAPRNPTEFGRILAPGGALATVTPEPAHLASLRSALGLMDIEQTKHSRLESSLAGAFVERSRQSVQFEVPWGLETLRDVVAMGPNAFHLGASDLDQRLTALALPLAVTVAVSVSVWALRG